MRISRNKAVVDNETDGSVYYQLVFFTDNKELIDEANIPAKQEEAKP